jgi:lactoylglutathione lyase
MNFTINHIQHIGIPVADLNISEAFYKKLGLENVMQCGVEFNGDKGKVCMVQQGEMIIEIYQMPEKEMVEIRSRNNGHIDHIAFDVANIEEALKN